MKKQNIIRKILLVSGATLLIIAVATLFIWQRNIHLYQQRAETYVSTLRTLIPQPQNAVPESRRDNTMATLSLEGTDFVGILELPRYNSTLPVCADWGNTAKYPCLFDGSVYDRTIQIGATTQKGQYDFYRELSVGDSVFFTDMEGNRYAYTISNLRYEKHADQATLQKAPAALTLFVKNIYAFEYLIVSCDVLS